MGRDWPDPEEEWLDSDEGWSASDEGYSEYDEAEFDPDWDAYEGYAGFDDGDPQADPDWQDSYPDWEEGDPHLYAPAYGFRLGFGFVMTCALIVGFMLSLVLYRATSASIALLDEVSQNVQTPARTGSGNAQEQSSGEQQAKDSAQVSVEVCAVSALFPQAILRWCDLITHYANKHGLPPDLIAALIWQESGGNPTAYSRSGAVGLMQVMPRDGLAASFMCQNGPCFSTRPTIEELKDPEFNVAYGTKMLAGLVRRSGSLREALRSYGPMNVGYYYSDKVLGIFQRYGDK